MKAILHAVVVLVLTSVVTADLPAFAASSFTQTDIGPETVFQIGNPSPGDEVVNTLVEIDITNGTSAIWNDYHFTLQAFDEPDVVTVAKFTFAKADWPNQKVSDTQIDLDGKLVLPGGIFHADIRIEHNTSVHLIGTPSISELIPEAGAGFLLLGGMAALFVAALARDRAHRAMFD